MTHYGFECIRALIQREMESGPVGIHKARGIGVVTGAIVGASKSGQLRQLISAADWRLSDAEVSEIERFLAKNPA